MPRSGSTFLYHNMARHPQVFAPARKEIDFFSLYYDQGAEWYAEFFADMRPDQLGCDISPVYMLDPNVIGRIQELTPNAKVIIGVRDPVDFVVSQYTQVQMWGYGLPPFAEFVNRFMYRRGAVEVAVELQGRCAVPVMLDAYRAAFGERLFLYDFAAFQRDPVRVLQAIERFLELPAYFTAETAETNRINASARRNFKLLSFLMMRESLVSAVRAVLPDRAVGALRRAVDRWSRADADATESPHPPEHVALAERLFRDQRGYVTSLFESADLVLGTGQPFGGDPVATPTA